MGVIPNKVSIDNLPEILQNKERSGDFETALMIGVNHKGE
jgi:hypothetical protein